jgi:hypothetical protein
MIRRRGNLGLVLLVLVGTIAPAASAQTPSLRADEGEWSGHVSFVGGGIPFRGSFQFTSAGGVVEGSFGWSSDTVSVGGVVSGPDTMPRFDLTSVLTGGIDVPDVSGGGEIMFTAGTCERLEGTGVNIDVAQMVDISSIVWWAIRTTSAPDIGAFLDAYDTLRQEVADVLATLETGAVVLGGGVLGRIEPLLAEAERLASQLNRTEGCGIEFYRSIIAIEIGQLFDFLLANPNVNEFVLAQILLTAARAGLIGSGNEAGPSDLDAVAQGLLEVRIASAIEAADPVELLILALVAEDLGWDDLAADARFALEVMGP